MLPIGRILPLDGAQRAARRKTPDTMTTHAIIETRRSDETPSHATVDATAEVLVCRDEARTTRGGAVARYLLGPCVSTTMGAYLAGEVEGLSVDEINILTAYTIESGTEDTDGEDIAVPFVPVGW